MLNNNIKFRFLLLFLTITSIGLLLPSSLFAQGRDRSKFQYFNDTTLTRTDTTGIVDTTITKKEPVDSTARIKNFKYDRKDSYIPKVAEYTNPLLLYKTSGTEYQVTFQGLDTVTIKQIVDGEDTKVPVKLPFEKYLELRGNLALKNQLYSIVAEKFKIESKDELEQLFKNITDITIPLPFSTETIFGPPTINLKINGLIDITASYQRSNSDQTTIAQTDQSQNNINFKQEVQVTTKGSIGDKLTIDADWNSQRTFDYENQLKLKYTGYPDEVIQSLEAGNVSLETKSNLIGSTQALFGIKGQFKLGPLTFTAIASQKKSEKKEVNITGGSQEVNFEIPAYQYSDNHFFLDTFYMPSYEEYYKYGSLRTPALIHQQVSPDIEVWAQTTPSNPNKRYAVCWINLPTKPVNGNYDPKWSRRDTTVEGYKTQGYFYKLNPGDYTLNDQAGYITININTLPSPNDAIAVAYKFANDNTVQYGTYSTDPNVPKDSLVLKLIRYPGLQPPSYNSAYHTAWIHKIKSIYSIGATNIKNDPNKFQFSIYYKPASGESQQSFESITYLNRTKLDIRANGNYTIVPNGDGQFDFFPGYTIDLTAGEVIFPTLSPFFETLKHPDIGNPLPNPVADSIIAPDSAIYVNSKTDVQSQNNPVKFYMGGKATGDASSRYSLGFNVVEGSVKVFNGSVLLAAGADYTVDYTTGELVIRNASVLTAGANLKITYETNDLFQLASKTLLGTRAEYQINKTSYVGFTLLNLKQQTLNDKVRIGEEPTNNTIMGFDASSDIKTNFMTKLVNKLPGYNTKEESLLSLKGEVAFMIPDPNTKKSVIPSDNGESVAYIDDFEGAKKLISLGLNPLSWIVSSIPKDSLISPWVINSPESDSLMNIRRSKLEWYNLINDVAVNDVYPNRQLGNSTNRTLTPLVFKILPKQPGMFTYETQSAFDSLSGGPKKKWTGVFKYLNTSQTNLVDENMGFIQIWMQVDNNNLLNDSAKMEIDLGIITEKVIANRKIPTQIEKGINYHTEDLNNNGTLDANEDVGLDGIPDGREQQLFPNLGSDPSGDNFAWAQGSTDFTNFNGTEGNANLTEGRRIDTEDLNGNGGLDEVDNYFRYEVSLSDTTHNKYITGEGNYGWRQYSIPLNDYIKAFGSASLTNVQYIRVWFKGIDKDTATLKIVDFNIVGNQWQKTNKNDTSYSIAVVNVEENPDVYTSPVPGDILRQSTQTTVDNSALVNEQSMSLEVRNLVQGPGKFAYKFFNAKPLDLLNYKIIKFFVNGDPNFKYTDTSNYDAAMVMRIGSDSLNYYEYRAPIHPDVRHPPTSPWNPNNEVSINMSDLSLVKQIRDSVGTLTYIPVPNGPPGAKYGVIGNPSLTAITQIALGVVNNKKSIVASPVSGSIWFDELRVLKTNDKNGYAFTLNAALKLADLGTFNLSYSKTDPNFHSLEGRFGDRILSNSWEFSGTLNLHKILNSLLASALSVKLKDFFTIPISFSHSEVFDQPVYLSGTDVDLETAVQNKYNAVYAQTGDKSFADYSANQVRIASQTLRVVNRFSINGFKFTFPSDNFFAREILNKMEFNFYRNSTTERSPQSESKYTWDMGGSVALSSNLNLMDKLHLNIGKLLPLGEEFKNAKIYFFFPFIGLAPLYSSSIGLGTNFTRNRGDEQLRGQEFPSPTSRNFNANRNFSLDWKFIENWLVDITGNYSFTAGSDLTYLETTNDSLKQQRSESQIFHDIFFHNALINFGKDLSYNQGVTINPKINIPGLRQFVDITASYRVQYTWQPSLQSVNLGSTTGYTADIQTSAALKLNQFYNLFKSTKIQNHAGSQTQDDGQKQSLGELLKILGNFLPDQINLNYSQQKGIANGGVVGRPGFANFWVLPNSNADYGPSRLYQLGWSNYPGKRVPGVNLSDAESYSNTLNFSTFITPIFPNNLKISFSYKTSWINNNQLSYVSNESGEIGSPTSVFSIKTVTRPSFLVSGDIVSKLANPLPESTTKAKEISDSFEKNVVSFPFPGWDLTLSGIEKFEMFSNFASSISFENAYSSDYKKTIKNNGIEETVDQQGITSGFTPLVGVNVTFKELEGGNLTASFKLSKTNNYDLTPSDLVVTNTATSDLSLNASYSKSGFKIPLFGLSLDNDLSISFSYTRTKNDPRTIKYELGIWSDDAQNGSVSTTLNPSIQYALSKSVTIQVFYKYTKVEPTQGSIQIPTRTSNEAGLNLKLSIQ